MAKEGRQERRYRAKSTLRHGLLGCYIEVGEDVNLDILTAEGVRWKRYPDEIQTMLDDGYVELYFVPPGTPHVVHSRGKVEHVDIETGVHSEVMTYSDAAKQWAGETVFIERYVETKAAELPQGKE